MAEKISATEKIFTIPLREAYKKAHDKRVPYAARLVKKYLQTHMKAETVKMGKHLNEELWSRCISKPPRRVRVKAFKEGDVVKVELMGFDYVDFKAQPKKDKKDMKEKLLERLGPKALKKEEEEKKIEGQQTPEKSKAVEKHEVGE
ncbi:MAG TPA: 50S ribosomal protein L31e [archaeon]|nr:50S ribosomal protein L31e [archaeon]